MIPENETRTVDNRRAFLKTCGRFAVITPPAVTFLLSTSMSSKAIAASSGGGSPLGVLAAGAGATVLGAEELSPKGQVAPGQQVAPGEAPPGPLMAPPPAAPAPPVPVWSGIVERG